MGTGRCVDLYRTERGAAPIDLAWVAPGAPAVGGAAEVDRIRDILVVQEQEARPGHIDIVLVRAGGIAIGDGPGLVVYNHQIHPTVTDRCPLTIGHRGRVAPAQAAIVGSLGDNTDIGEP